MPALLAFDTATERLHIGLAVGDSIWLHESEGGARASAALIPGLYALLRDAGIGLDDLDAIAFGRGPGAFTGLRTACAAAQGLAFGSHKPVLPVDTLMAVAEDAREHARVEDVWVAMDARMDEIYAGHYRFAAGAWQTIVAPALYGLDALNAQWTIAPPISIAGTAPTAFGARLDTRAAQVLADARPGGLALLACARAGLAHGEAADATMAVPLYLRDRVAFTTAEREAGVAGRGAR
jgi:tRNA threonylcarbamoyladenosine biosynthesis protein TsaB